MGSAAITNKVCIATDDIMGVKIGYIDVRCESESHSLVYTIHSTVMPVLTDGEEYLIQLRRIGEVCEIKVDKRNIAAVIEAQNL